MDKPDVKEPEQAYPNLSEQKEFARKLLTRDLAKIYKAMKGKIYNAEKFKVVNVNGS